MDFMIVRNKMIFVQDCSEWQKGEVAYLLLNWPYFGFAGKR